MELKRVLDYRGEDRDKLYLGVVGCSLKVKKHRYLLPVFNFIKKGLQEELEWRTHKNRWDEEIWFFVNCVHKVVGSRAKGFCLGKDYKTFPSRVEATYNKTWRMLEVLHELGWVDIVVGGKSSTGFYEKNYLTIVMVGRNILAMVDNIVGGVATGASSTSDKTEVTGREYCYDDEVVFIRDRETKREIRLVKNDVYERTARIVGAYNKALRNTSIEYKGERMASQQYRRIFTDDYTKGGRLYNEIGGIQTAPKYMRRCFTIEGEPLAEVDFKAMHPSLLYQDMYNKDPDLVLGFLSDYEKIEGKEFDMYPCEDTIKFIELAEGSEDRARRDLVKYATLICLNTRKRESASKPIRKHINSEGVYGEVDINMLVDSIVSHHKLIEGEFFKDKGIYLQNTDSEVMMEIIDSCLSDGIIVLPLHDGVMCKERDKYKVAKIFKDSWMKIFNDDFFCEVEVS